jgi:hypothetical protein
VSTGIGVDGWPLISPLDLAGEGRNPDEPTTEASPRWWLIAGEELKTPTITSLLLGRADPVSVEEVCQEKENLHPGQRLSRAHSLAQRERDERVIAPRLRLTGAGIVGNEAFGAELVRKT